MSFKFHKNRDIYFDLQKSNTDKYIIPFIERVKKIEPTLNVLEVGCRDGGVLFPFLEKGCHITGVEISEKMLDQAKKRYANAIEDKRAHFVALDIHNFNTDQKFDIIILKDVIEHVYNHEKLIKKLKLLLARDGIIYFGYPPWQNPFGGHQQIAANKVLLPNFIYLGILKLVREKTYGFLKATKETRITIEGFRNLIARSGLKIVLEEFYLINPMYEIKFGLKPRRQFRFIRSIPYLRNYFTTTCDCIVSY